MSTTIAAILMIGGTLGAVVAALGVLVFIGLVVYDVASWSGSAPVSSLVAAAEEAGLEGTEEVEHRIRLERGVARTFVILGGAFWGIATFAGWYWFKDRGMTSALMAASIPFVATLVTLIIGWYWERLTAALLVAASAAAVVWGVTHGFEAGVWALIVAALIGPMLTAAVLFWMARRDQKALELRLSLFPELQLAPAEGTLP